VDVLANATVESVLDRLGFTTTPSADRRGLAAIYVAWCRNIPFDNLVKRADLAARTAPFRNDEPEAFFALYLEHGTGGTCWPSSRALGALLRAVGFDLTLGSAAMADEVFGVQHTHGTVLVNIAGERWWVDSSMLTDEPVPLRQGVSTALAHPLRPVRIDPVDDRWRVHWKPANGGPTMGCLLLDDDVNEDHYSERYEWSRGPSPFNGAVHATTNRSDRALTIRADRYTVLDAGGAHHSEQLDLDARAALLVDEFGYSEEVVAALPPDAI
jgi:arylamine N-acetyltransferase